MDSKIADLPEDCQSLLPANGLEMERYGLAPRNNLKNSFSNITTSLEKNRINLQWKNIKYKTVDGKTILNGLYGSSNSGELTAIMGPSGSGKTSLVNILSGFVKKGVSGQVLVNGAKRDVATFRKLTCYILQDDYILPRFTVREIITFASKLKIPSTVSEKERQKAVNDCIYGLGLVGQQHQRANTLSGGQKKRLCIAQEIVNNPPLMFLDEPTSGLDSSSCLQCVLLLKTLAEQGKNIVCTIHQPSSRIYEIFDNLYMLSDGDCIYRGPTKDLLPYLDNQGFKCPKYHSPTDFLMDIAIGLYGEWLTKLKEEVNAVDVACDGWYSETDVDVLPESTGKNNVATLLGSTTDKVKEILQDCWNDMTSNQYSTSNFNQFRVLVKRSFLNQLRDPIHMRLKFFGSIVIGLLLGGMYYNTGNDGTKTFNTTGLLFTLLVFIIITAKVPTVLTFPLQRTVFEREHQNGWYSTMIYYLATTAAELPYQILCPVINCSLLYWLTGQPPEFHRLFFFVLSAILTALISESIGLMIGAVSNIQKAIYLCVITTGFELVGNGLILQTNITPIFFRWIMYFMHAKYALRSAFLSLYKNRGPLECSSKKAICFFKDSAKFLKHIDMDGNLMFDFFILFIFLFVARTCSFFLLHVKLSIRK